MLYKILHNSIICSIINYIITCYRINDILPNNNLMQHSMNGDALSQKNTE